MPASSTTVGPAESAPRTWRWIRRPSTWTSNPGAGYRRRSRIVSTCWTVAAEPIAAAANSAALRHLIGYLINTEHVPSPGIKIYEQPIHEVVARAKQRAVLCRIGELPVASSQIVPGGAYQASCCAVAQIDDDEPPGITFPAPGDEVLIAIVSWPSRPITQLPTAAPECRIGHGRQEGAIEGTQGLVSRLFCVPA